MDGNVNKNSQIVFDRDQVLQSLPEVISWLSDHEKDTIASADYWNDEEVEKKKAWYIRSTYDTSLARYLRDDTRLEKAFLDLLLFAQRRGYVLHGICLDVAAGVCWTSAITALQEKVQKVFAVDISRHRLEKIAPLVIQMYNAPAEKIQRVTGSFYDIHLPGGSVDCVVMSQAFHHAFDIDRLLQETRRVVRKNGIVLITGEEPVGYYAHLKKICRTMSRLRPKQLVVELLRSAGLASYAQKLKVDSSSHDSITGFGFSFRTLYPPDITSGDHFYREKDYRVLLEKHGFKVFKQALPYRLTKASRQNAVNFLALKVEKS